MSRSPKSPAAPAGRFASLRRLFGRAGPPAGRPRPRTRLGLERLEAREVPAVFLVTNLNDAGAGSLRDAIAQVNSVPPTPVRPVIEFTAGLEHQTINLTTVGFSDGTSVSSSAFEIVNPVTILGTGETINRAGTADPFRLFFVEQGGDLRLQDLTLSGGLTLGDNNAGRDTLGGAVLSAGGQVELSGCTLTNNQAVGGDSLNPASADGGFGLGGAIANLGGGLSLINCTLTNNLASGGQPAPGGTAGSGRGGAIYTSGPNGSLTLVDCTVAGNVVSGDTSSQQASNGGAVYTFNGQVIVDNSILSGTPGGLDDLCNNGGKVFANDLTGASVIPTEVLTFNGGTTDTSAVVAADPQLGPLQDNGGPTPTMAPLPGSPALARVPFFGDVTTDQRGAARGPGMTDVGAYEVQNPLSPVGVPGDPAILFGPHPTASPNEAFVKGLYQATLLRAGESAGINFWVGQLNAGVSRASVAAGFYNSAENRANETKFFYREFLGREADAAGLGYWVGVLQSGVDEAVVMKGFLLSPEYSAKSDNGQFVSTMYYAILGRQGDASGFGFWKNALDTNKLSRGQVADAFIRSTEGVTRVVANDYQAYLGRAATPGDVAFWVGPVQSGVSFGTVAAGCLGSLEFYNAAAANVF